MRKRFPIFAVSLLCCSIFRLTLSAQETFTLHVSTDGHNGASGTLHDPLCDLQEAIDMVSDGMTSGKVRQAEILLSGGSYPITEAIQIHDLRYSLTITSEPGQEAVLSGELPIKNWTRVSGGGLLPKDSRPHVLSADLRKQGISDLGDVTEDGNRLDLYYKGERQQIARWPNEGFTHGGLSLGKTDVGDTWIHVHGTREGVIEYVDDRISSWKNEQDPRFFGYWYWDWADQTHKVSRIDSRAKTLTFQEPWHNYGYRDSCRFYGFNLLSELDTEKEFYVDRQKGRIYWWPEDGFTLDGSEAPVLSMTRAPWMIEIRNCEQLVIRNLSVVGSRGGAIKVDGGHANHLEGLHVARMGELAVSVTGGSGHAISGCLMEQLGKGAIEMTGGDRIKLQKSGFSVHDNIIQNFSLYKRTYAPAVHFTGCGLDILHNRFQYSSSSALRIEGNDVDIAYNQCFDLVRESDDQGGLDIFYNYSYRRVNLYYNHWKNILGGMYAGAAAIRFDDLISGHVVYGNVMERCGGGNFGGVQINGGKDIWISNNVFWDCQYAISCNAWDESGWKSKYEGQKDKVEAVNALGPIYRMHYPELGEPNDANLGRNYASDNLVIGARNLHKGGERFIFENNTLLKLEEAPGLESVLKDAYLENFGLQPIPFDEIGPKANRFM